MQCPQISHIRVFFGSKSICDFYSPLAAPFLPRGESAESMPCLVDFYDCLRAWANPKSVGYPPWRKGGLDCHEYYYEEFLTKPMHVQQKGGH